VLRYLINNILKFKEKNHTIRKWFLLTKLWRRNVRCVVKGWTRKITSLWFCSAIIAFVRLSWITSEIETESNVRIAVLILFIVARMTYPLTAKDWK